MKSSDVIRLTVHKDDLLPSVNSFQKSHWFDCFSERFLILLERFKSMKQTFSAWKTFPNLPGMFCLKSRQSEAAKRSELEGRTRLHPASRKTDANDGCWWLMEGLFSFIMGKISVPAEQSFLKCAWSCLWCFLKALNVAITLTIKKKNPPEEP